MTWKVIPQKPEWQYDSSPPDPGGNLTKLWETSTDGIRIGARGEKIYTNCRHVIFDDITTDDSVPNEISKSFWDNKDFPKLSRLWDLYTGAPTVAFGVEDLTGSGAAIVKVRREADDEEKDFTGKDIYTCGEWADGKLETTLPLDLVNKNVNITQFTLTVTSPQSIVDNDGGRSGTYTEGPPELIDGIMSLTNVWTNEHGTRIFGSINPFMGTSWAIRYATGAGFAFIWTPLNLNPWLATSAGGISGATFGFTCQAIQNINYTPNPAAAGFSMERIRTSYAGPSFQIRRESDNDEVDVYLDQNGKISNLSPVAAVVAETTGSAPHFYVTKAVGVARPLNGLRFEKVAEDSWQSTTDSDLGFQYINGAGEQGHWIAFDLNVTTYATSAPTDASTNPNDADWSNSDLSPAYWNITQDASMSLGDFIRADDVNTSFTFTNTSIDSFDGTYNIVSENYYVNEKETSIYSSAGPFGDGWFIISKDSSDIAFLDVLAASDPWDATGGSGHGIFDTPNFTLTSSGPVYTVGENACVVTSYDHSTESNDATQYTAANQPKIAIDGVLLDKITFNNANEQLVLDDAITISHEFDVDTSIQTNTSGSRSIINSDTKELIIYTSDQTSNTFRIESNINYRYSIYVPSPTNAGVVTVYDQIGENDLNAISETLPQIVKDGRYLGYIDTTNSSTLSLKGHLSGSISRCRVTEDAAVRTYDFDYISPFPSIDQENYVYDTKLLTLVYHEGDQADHNLAIQDNMSNQMDATNFTYFNYFSHVLRQSIDNRIVGADPSTQIDLYTTQNHGSSSYVRNPDFWLDTHKSKLTAISPYNSHQSNNRAGIAITPRHIICANHYAINVNSTIRFIAADNTVVDRTVVGTERIGSTDIEVQILDSDLPSSITPCKIFPSDFASRFPTNSNGAEFQLRRTPFLALDQEEKGLINEVSTFSTTSKTISWLGSPSWASSTADRKAFGESLVSGDSGNPMLFVTKTELWLFSVAHYAYQGPFISLYISEINNAINSLDTAQGISSGYTVTEGQWVENV